MWGKEVGTKGTISNLKLFLELAVRGGGFLSCQLLSLKNLRVNIDEEHSQEIS